MLTFDNRFLRELPGEARMENFPRQVHGACWSAVAPAPVAAPRLLAWSAAMAQQLGLVEANRQSPELLDALAGNALLPGMQTWASNYGGHQFGQWAGQLGDGRAIFLGEVVAPDQSRWELQLKGAGPTPYSRRADGRAVLRSSIREFVCSEAMHHLGVPTTRALSLVGSGEGVLRDILYDGHARLEPGAIVCRVAPSFLRFGHFELLAARGDHALLGRLVQFTIRHYFPDIAAAHSEPAAQVGAWFAEVARRTAQLLAQWMRVGFVHGVMNTDNMSILGLTIDYGPYGWLENFDPGWTPNTTDGDFRRYCFGRQPEIARWNLECLGAALRPLLNDDSALLAGIAAYDAHYAAAISTAWAAKLGFSHWQAEDSALLTTLFDLLYRSEADMSDFFRRLASLDLATDLTVQSETLRPSSYAEARWQSQADDWHAWLRRYGARSDLAGSVRRVRMNAVNPLYVPRNYLAQQVIDAAEAGDASGIARWLEVLRHPYDEQPDAATWAALRPDWARHKVGCSMLSCSS